MHVSHEKSPRAARIEIGAARTRQHTDMIFYPERALRDLRSTQTLTAPPFAVAWVRDRLWLCALLKWGARQSQDSYGPSAARPWSRIRNIPIRRWSDWLDFPTATPWCARTDQRRIHQRFGPSADQGKHGYRARHLTLMEMTLSISRAYPPVLGGDGDLPPSGQNVPAQRLCASPSMSTIVPLPARNGRRRASPSGR